MFYVYVLRSKKDGKIYIGVTSNLRQRFREHNTKKVGSTRYRTPLILVYYEAYRSFKDAINREKKLKHFKNTYKELKKRIFYSLPKS